MGTGIEITLDVEFTVNSRKGRSVCWPRGGNDGYIFTSEMLVRWIRRLKSQHRKCFAGFRKTSNWTLCEHTFRSATAVNASWRTSTTRRSQWYVNRQRAGLHTRRAMTREARGNQ